MSKTSLIIFLILLSTVSIAAAEGTSTFADALQRTGFVNIRTAEQGAGLVVAAENRRYRSPARGLAEILRQSRAHLDGADSLHVVMLHQTMPVLRVSTSSDDLRALLNGALDYTAWSTRSRFTMEVSRQMASLNDAQVRATPVLRSWDVAVGSTVRYQLGNYGSRSDNYRVAVDLEPELRLDLPAGVQARARLAVPVWNNFDNNTHVRPAVLSLSRPFRASDALFGVVSAGVFTRNRAGVHASLMQYVSDERFRIGFDIGHTTFTPINGRVAIPAAERQDYTVYQAVAGWHLRRHRLDLSARYGMFLYRDQGVRLDMTRSFGDGDVGFFLLSGSNGRNGGFRFRIALPPRTYIRPIPARIRPAEGFNLGYRYEGGGFDIREYETGNRAIIDLSLYYPALVLFELEQYIAV
jgi:hypothetical protein